MGLFFFFDGLLTKEDNGKDCLIELFSGALPGTLLTINRII